VTSTLDLPAQLAELWRRLAAVEAGRTTLRLGRAPVPLLALGLTTDLTITWDTPMPSEAYTVRTSPDTALLGKITVTVKSQTREGCVLTVKATLAVSLGSSVLAIAHT
jgi:hypothetical protein